MLNGPYTAAQVLDVGGISRRQLSKWLAAGILHPSVRASTGTGTDHLFAFCDLLQVVTLKTLRTIGCSLDAAAPAARYLAGLVVPDDLGDENALGDVLLVRPGDGHFIVASALELIDELRAAPAAVVVLRVRDIQRDVVAAAAEWMFRGRPRRGQKKGAAARSRHRSEHAEEPRKPRKNSFQADGKHDVEKSRARKPQRRGTVVSPVPTGVVGGKNPQRKPAKTKQPKRSAESGPTARHVSLSSPSRSGRSTGIARLAARSTRRVARRRARRAQRTRGVRRARSDCSDPAPAACLRPTLAIRVLVARTIGGRIKNPARRSRRRRRSLRRAAPKGRTSDDEPPPGRARRASQRRQARCCAPRVRRVQRRPRYPVHKPTSARFARTCEVRTRSRHKSSEKLNRLGAVELDFRRSGVGS